MVIGARQADSPRIFTTNSLKSLQRTVQKKKTTSIRGTAVLQDCFKLTNTPYDCGEQKIISECQKESQKRQKFGHPYPFIGFYLFGQFSTLYNNTDDIKNQNISHLENMKLCGKQKKCKKQKQEHVSSFFQSSHN